MRAHASTYWARAWKTIRLLGHLQQVEENFAYVPISTVAKLEKKSKSFKRKVLAMASVISESFVARASYLSDEKERQIDKLQRQFYELKKQCHK